MYLLLITTGMCFAYIFLYYLFSYFFKNSATPLNRSAFYSILYIILSSLAAYKLSFAISDPELGNRIMHMFGGGFLAFFYGLGYFYFLNSYSSQSIVLKSMVPSAEIPGFLDFGASENRSVFGFSVPVALS